MDKPQTGESASCLDSVGGWPMMPYRVRVHHLQAEVGQHQHHVQVLKLLLQDDPVGLQAHQLYLQPLLLVLKGVPRGSRPASPRQEHDTPVRECVSA